MIPIINSFHGFVFSDYNKHLDFNDDMDAKPNGLDLDP